MPPEVPTRRWSPPARALGVVAAVLLLGAAAACGSSRPAPAGPPSSGPTVGPTALAAHPPPPDTPGPGRRFYVSMGDSYAAGWQPADVGAAPSPATVLAPDASTTPDPVSTDPGWKAAVSYGGTTTNGFAYQLAARTIGGTGLTLVNYGCSGATTTGMIDEVGCLPQLLGPGAPLYATQSQADAAIAFIAAHRDEVGLITVVIGANDVTRCIGVQQLRPCLKEPLATVRDELATFLPRLRAAAGPDVPIVGLTYPDVILGGYVSRTDNGATYAARAAAGFRDLINPVLAQAYSGIGARFVDITRASGAYLPATVTEELPPYGRVPAAVARACLLTYYCQLMDLHPRTAGYTLIADQVEQALAR